MPDVWIITDRRPYRHATLDRANAEKARLAALHPEKKFTVLRCKTHVRPSHSHDALVTFAETIANFEFTADGVDSIDVVNRLIGDARRMLGAAPDPVDETIPESEVV